MKNTLSFVFVAAVLAGPASAQTTTSPANPPPVKKPAKKDLPIDPNKTGGARDNGASITVRVLLKGKPVDAISVMANNLDGTLAGNCEANLSGECTLSLGTGSYTFTAVGDGLTGKTTTQIYDVGKTVVIDVKQAK